MGRGEKLRNTDRLDVDEMRLEACLIGLKWLAAHFDDAAVGKLEQRDEI